MLTIIAAYLSCGTLVGLLSGLFGIGGGIVGIPVLLHCFNQEGVPPSIAMHMAIGTMLAVAATTTLTAMQSHHKKKMILVPLFKQIAPYLVGGSLIGTIISSHMDATNLERIFAIFLLFAAFRMVKRSDRDVKRLDLGKAAATSDSPEPGHLLASPEATMLNPKSVPLPALCIGIVSGLLGLGGGILLVPYLHWRGIPLNYAIATSTACILPAAAIGAISYMMMNVPVNVHANVHVNAHVMSTDVISTQVMNMHVNADMLSAQAQNVIALSSGYIYWPAFLGISVMSMLFAPLGAHLTHRASAPALKAAFSVLLIAIAFNLSK